MNGSRHRIRHSGESRNPEGEGGTNPAWAIGAKACPGHPNRPPNQPMHPIFIPWCAGASRQLERHGRCRRVRKHVPDSAPGWMVPATEFVIPAKAGIQGGGWRQPHPNTSSDQVSFSYLGVPAPADMSDWYESMSRTPTRDGFRHRPATPTTVARTTTAEGRKRDVALGLAPCRRVAAAGHCHYGPHFVIPAKAGIQGRNRRPPPIFIPQCAGGNRRGRFLWNLAPPRLATD